MNAGAGVSLGPLCYVVTIEARVCGCTGPSNIFGRFRRLDRAVKLVTGYWSVYLAFYGDQLVWLHFLITDLRDGRVVWRNGQLLTTKEGIIDGTNEGHESGGGGG